MSLFIANNKMMSINGIPLMMPNVEAFTFKVDTTKGNALTSFKIPTVSGYTSKFRYRINGIGSWTYITSWNQAETLIPLPSSGVHTIEMMGESAWSFNNTGDKDKLIQIISWGDFLFNYLAYGFYGCLNLKLPTSGSINAPNIDSLHTAFAVCNLMEVVNGDMFRRCVNVKTFNSVFATNSITNIHKDLFKYNINTTTFYAVFYNNQLTSIPANLFDNCLLVTNFQQAFAINRLTSIPANLFDYCLLVTNFYGTFATNRLTSITYRLFYYNRNVTDYSWVFKDGIASGCTLPSEIFYLDATTLNKVTTWTNAFTQSSTAKSPIGTVQDIWNYASGSSVKTDCFLNCTALSNYASIPVEWV